MRHTHSFHSLLFVSTREKIVVGLVLFCAARVFSCGGGVVPYVPTQSGAGGGSTGQFVLMEKGVAVDMFDVKKLQPLFRNIILTGNERKSREAEIRRTKDPAKTEKTQDQSDTTAITEDQSGSSREPAPVLNIHRLH